MFNMKQHPWDQYLLERLQAWSDEGLARELHLVEGGGVKNRINGTPVVSFASNDYLGLAGHPEIAQAAAAVLNRTGAGASASPLITGYRTEHQWLENRLAAFKQSESALVLASGFQASLAALVALTGPDDTILADRLSHASLLDGAQLSGARLRVFKHNDIADVQKLLEKEQRHRCLVVAESLYSMDGDTAPIEELVEITDEAGGLLLLDEAHATGVLGPSGRGALEELTARSGGMPRHVIALGTLSKALASQGGFICARREIIANIVHSGRAYLYSTALSPVSAAAANAALELVDREPERRVRLLKMAAEMRAGLTKLNLETFGGSAGPIVPVLAGTELRALSWSQQLFEAGFYVPAIRYPTVKKGQARLRISLSAGHTEEHCASLLKAMKNLR
jgi:8-amino-7-oxononanoate synthase